MVAHQIAWVAGHGVAALTLKQTVEYMVAHALRRRSRDGLPGYYSSINGQVVALAERDLDLQQALRDVDLLSCDSQPVVIYTRWFGAVALPERVATTDLIHHLAKRSSGLGLTFYLLGATAEVSGRAAETLERLHPGLRIVGQRDGYFDEAEEAMVCEEISRLAPDILWVGMGVPREQAFVMRNRHRLDVGIVKTSGGCFRVLAGEVKRVPKWMQHAGFEWLGRLFFEPRHVFMRYLITCPRAVWYTMRSKPSS